MRHNNRIRNALDNICTYLPISCILFFLSNGNIIMKKYLIFVIAVLIVFASDAFASPVFAGNWTPLPIRPVGQSSAGGEGFQKGFDCKFAPSNGDIVYRVNDTSGVWKSIDAGASWYPINQGFRFMGGASIGVHPTDPNIVLVGGSSMESAADITSSRESGISRTTDGGANWVTATSTTNGSDVTYVRCMFARDRKTSDLFAWVGGGTSTVYCGTARQGILRSTDLGATWKVVVPYSVTGQIYDMDLRGTGTNANKIIVASANGLTQYTDDGSAPNGYTTASTSGITGTAIVIEVDQNDPNIMYAANTTTLYKSSGLVFSTSGVDNAEFTSGINNGATIQEFRLCDANTDKMYIHLFKTTTPTPFSYWYVSSNAGVNFTKPTEGTWDEDGTVYLFNTWVASVNGSAGGIFIACHPTNDAIVLVQNTLEQTLKSTNSGSSFAYSNSGFTGYALNVTNGKSVEAFVSGSSTSIRTGGDFGMWMSGDDYSTYVRMTEPSGGQSDFDAIAIEPGTLTPVLICAFHQLADGLTYIFRSASGSFGSSWTKKTPTYNTPVDHGFRLIKFNENDTNYIYAGVYRSTDKGVSWANMASGALAIYPANNDIIYSITGTSACRILKCTNGRAATPVFSTASPTFTLTGGWQIGEGFCVSPNNQNKWYVPAGNDGVWVVNGTSTGIAPALKNNAHGLTTDGTSNWNYRLCVADPNNPDTIYALAQCHPNFRGGGVFRSTDGGLSWNSISSGTELAYSNPYSMTVDPNTSYLHVWGFNGGWSYNADAPLIDIEIPTTLNYYGTSSATLTISGSASDADGIDYVNYVLTGDTTGVGTATGTATWSKAALAVNTGTTTVTFTAMDLSGNSTTDYIIIGRSATVPENEVPDMIFPYTEDTIVIDGNTSEWGTSTPHDIGLTIAGIAIGTASAEAKGLWDDNYLYVSITGTDTGKNNDTGTTAPHLDTGAAIYLDMDNNGGPYGANDFHYELPWNQSNFIWEVGGNTSTVSSSMSSTANGYTLEIRFPWSLLGISGTSSTTFGADFQQNIDSDGGNSRESVKGAFNSLDTNYYNFDDLGLILLGTVTVGAEPGSSSVTKLTGYIAEWKFNESSGSSTADSQGQNHGTHSGTGGRTISAGRYGNAVTVIGSSSFNCGSPAALDNVGTRTIVMQHKPTSDSGSICGKSGTPDSYWEFSTTKAYWFNMDFITTNLRELTANDVIVLGEWQTCAVTWDGGSTTANIKHYVNGELVSPGTAFEGVGAYVDDSARNWFLLNRNTGASPLTSAVDNLSMFSRILSAQELLDCAAYIQATTTTALDITSLTATLYGSMSITYGTTNVTACFDYGTASGTYTGSTTAQNTSRSTVGVSNVIHAVSGLLPSTTYYYRLRNDNPAYMATGTEQSFATLSADATVPTLEIVYPIASPGTMTTQSLVPLLISGSASDNMALSHVVWKNVEMGTSGTCNGTVEWNVQEFPIQEGTNTCKITAFDTTNNQGTATVSIFRNLDSPVVEITSPVLNCWLTDGTEAFGTTSSTISFEGLSSDYNGVGSVTMSITGSTTVTQASGTSSFALSVPIGTNTLNRVHFTARDVPLQNQGTATMAAGRFPAVSTTDATSVSYTSAMLNGSCYANLNTSTVWFEYGLTSGEYIGSSTTVQLIGDAETAVSLALGALNKGTEYFYRLRGSNSIGETYGEEFNFTTVSGYTLEEVTGLNRPLSWSLIKTTQFMVGMKKYGIYNWETVWRSTEARDRLIRNPDDEITNAIDNQ